VTAIAPKKPDALVGFQVLGFQQHWCERRHYDAKQVNKHHPSSTARQLKFPNQLQQWSHSDGHRIQTLEIARFMFFTFSKVVVRRQQGIGSLLQVCEGQGAACLTVALGLGDVIDNGFHC